MRNVRLAPFVQGTFYVAPGLWPIVHFRSFEAITGKKKEPWLVKTMGALITSVGVALLSGARDRRTSTKTLGIASALVLAGADVVFSGFLRLLCGLPVYVWVARTARRHAPSASGAIT